MSEGQPIKEPLSRQHLAERFRTIDGAVLRSLTEASLNWLRTNQKSVNSLNVFPVPDGDTGTNMTLTMQSAWDEIKAIDDPSIGRVAHAIAHGALMGARGNSGVILSQLWRGFARSLDDLERMDAETFVKALQEARDTAYRGVVRPVEGTILTVSKDVASASAAALQNGATSSLDILEHAVQAADESVQHTPELLPVLKEAGVVDAGGRGLHLLLEGMLRAILGLPLDQPVITVQPLSALALERAAEATEPGQDWEVVVDFVPDQSLEVKSFYQRLEAMGTSIQIGEGDGMYRMHIHVPDKTEYEPVHYIRSLGTIRNISIENLMTQVEERNRRRAGADLKLAAVKPGTIAAIAVASGTGLARVFASLGAAAIVEGGQTMNPSTEEILNACDRLPTDRVVILPNNKNIILAAEQAARLTNKQVRIVPSTSMPQGVAAMLALNPDGDLEQVAGVMSAALGSVRTGEITKATRSVEIDGVHVRQGQVIGLLNGSLRVSGDDLPQVTLDLLAQAQAHEAELITMYIGEDLAEEAAKQLAERVRAMWPNTEVELVEGCQPHYQLILSIE